MHQPQPSSMRRATSSDDQMIWKGGCRGRGAGSAFDPVAVSVVRAVTHGERWTFSPSSYGDRAKPGDIVCRPDEHPGRLRAEPSIHQAVQFPRNRGADWTCAYTRPSLKSATRKGVPVRVRRRAPASRRPAWPEDAGGIQGLWGAPGSSPTGPPRESMETPESIFVVFVPAFVPGPPAACLPMAR